MNYASFWTVMAEIVQFLNCITRENDHILVL